MSADATPRAGESGGVLRLLVNRVRDGDLIYDAQPLAWTGEPPGACWSDTFQDFDLGDYSCVPVPSLPPGPDSGLWLLTWAWELEPDPEADPDDDEGEPEMVAEYADTCEWRRPTMADLVALGVLPSAEVANER